MIYKTSLLVFLLIIATVSSTTVASGLVDGQISRTVCNSFATQANTLTSVDEIVGQCTVPANTLDINGRTIRITIGGTTAANTNTKVFKIYWGGTGSISQAITGGTLCSPSIGASTSGVIWVVSCFVTRTSSDNQLVWGGQRCINASGSGACQGGAIATATLTDSAANLVNITTNAPVASDMTFKALMVEVVN